MKGVTLAWETIVKIILVMIFLLAAVLIIMLLYGNTLKDLSILNATSFIEGIFK